jgi:diguanylate cyclase (GGDEF)-like protein
VATLRLGTQRTFADPLGASDPEGTRRRIRHVHAVTFAGASVSLLLAVLSDGGPASQRIASAAAMVATALVAVVMLRWRDVAERLLLAAFPLATLTVTAVAVLDPPLALTPIYYVWPLMTAAYFLRRSLVLATYGIACGSFGAAMLFAYRDGPRFIDVMSVVIVGAVVVGFVRALTARMEQLIARLHALAREDALTGCLNRRAFMERLDGELARARRARGACAVAVLDIDLFKDINDRFGHAAGDAALRRLVASTSARLRRGDELGRIGGDEFAVVLAGTNRAGAEAFAEEVRARVALDAADAGMPFTVSVGVASATTEHASVDALLAAADAALYRAKRAGRDAVHAAARSEQASA